MINKAFYFVPFPFLNINWGGAAVVAVCGHLAGHSNEDAGCCEMWYSWIFGDSGLNCSCSSLVTHDVFLLYAPLCSAAHCACACVGCVRGGQLPTQRGSLQESPTSPDSQRASSLLPPKRQPISYRQQPPRSVWPSVLHHAASLADHGCCQKDNVVGVFVPTNPCLLTTCCKRAV